jgi:hypothetical protein
MILNYCKQMFLITYHYEDQFYIMHLKYDKKSVNVYHLNLYINEDFVHDLHQIHKIEVKYFVHQLFVMMHCYYYYYYY